MTKNTHTWKELSNGQVEVLVNGKPIITVGDIFTARVICGKLDTGLIDAGDLL